MEKDILCKYKWESCKVDSKTKSLVKDKEGPQLSGTHPALSMLDSGAVSQNQWSLSIYPPGLPTEVSSSF